MSRLPWILSRLFVAPAQPFPVPHRSRSGCNRCSWNFLRTCKRNTNIRPCTLRNLQIFVRDFPCASDDFAKVNVCHISDEFDRSRIHRMILIFDASNKRADCFQICLWKINFSPADVKYLYLRFSVGFVDLFIFHWSRYIRIKRLFIPEFGRGDFFVAEKISENIISRIILYRISNRIGDYYFRWKKKEIK